MSEEIDFATSARIGFAALLERIDAMLERGTVSYDDYNDIEDIADVFRAPALRVYYDELMALFLRTRDLPLDVNVRLSITHQMCLALARSQRALERDAMDGWERYVAGVRSRQPQFNPGVETFLEWLLGSGLIQNLCTGIHLKTVGNSLP